MADFSELTVGYSATGAEEYLQNLNAELITGTKSLIRDKFSNVKTALEAGWVGNAEVSFVNNMYKASEELCETLDSLRDAIDGMLGAVEDEMTNRDNTIVEEYFN